MKSRTTHSKMPNSLKGLAIIFSLAFTLFIIQSCTNDEFSNSETDKTISEVRSGQTGFKVANCDGIDILKFNSLDQLQDEHLALYQDYNNGNEEELILINFENTNGYYSLRKKENDMDDGVIPYDPNFDETDYTFDPIFETLLNQDGMIIIDNRLYIWDSGCVIHSIPFSCDGYQTLLGFRDAALSGEPELMFQLFFDNGMENINVCDDLQYDLEYVSGNGGIVDTKDIPVAKNDNGCGYDVFLNKELISCANDSYLIKISFTYTAPIGTQTALNLFYINATEEEVLDEVQYSFSQFGGFSPIPINNQNQNYGYLIPTVGEISFYLSIPRTDGVIVDVSLASTINALTANSCLSTSKESINLSCPLGITKKKIAITSTTAEWAFNFPIGDGACGYNINEIVWNFGDGTIVANSSASYVHTYITPCLKKTYTVTAHINGDLCDGSSEGFYTTDVTVGGCNRRTYTFPTKKGKEGGKRYKQRSKIKKRNTKAIVKHIYKWRKPGTKTITSSGNFYSPTANNVGSCNLIDMTSLVPTKTQSGKRRNKQKVKLSGIYQINALDPYEVTFSHPNANTYTLTATDLYCPQ